MANAILVINAGSSSLKFSAFAPNYGMDPVLLLKGQIEGIGTRPRLTARDADDHLLVDNAYDATVVNGHNAAIAAVSTWLSTRGRKVQLLAAGHRVVHGGPDETAAVLITDDLLAKLEKLIPLVPLHQPANLAGIRALRAHHPTLPQVACFDTAFHRGHSAIVERFALPEPFYRDGVRRYGFHGLSYEYIVERFQHLAPQIASGKIIIAHLGNGASLCAVQNGRSVDSTMAFSSLDGLPMGTRCGAIDPGVLIYLIRERGMSVDQIERLLYNDSGLRGLSGLSSDARDLLASKDPAAKMALDYFILHVCRQLGSLTALLEGLDAIVFTAGIGEHSPEIREQICLHAAWLGVNLDEAANQAGGPRITLEGSPVSAWVIPTDEELIIARHTFDLIGPLSTNLMTSQARLTDGARHGELFVSSRTPNPAREEGAGDWRRQ